MIELRFFLRCCVGVAALLTFTVTNNAQAQLQFEEALTVTEIRFVGNRKVEEAALMSVMSSRKGQRFNSRSVATDVKALWSLGFFDDIQVSIESTKGGIGLIYQVTEKPAIRKIIVGGNDEVDLDKINEVLDLKRDSILDVAKVKRNNEKIRDLYVEKGFFLAEVDYRLRKASTNEVDVIFEIRENAKITVRRVNISGNTKIPDEDIKAVMGTREGGYLSFITSSGTYQEPVFERDMMILTALYYDEGYINVKVSQPQIALSADKQDLYISIHVEEGEQYRLGALDIKGDLLWPKEKVLEELTVKSGDIFSRSRLGQDVTGLADRYKDQGYAYANITPLTNIDNKKLLVDLTFEIEKGPVVYIERINVTGNSKTRDKVIRREMKIAEGDRYSQTLIDRSRARINALGYFETVNVNTTRGTADDRIIVNFEVQERATGTFQVGAGFSSVENFIAQAQVSQDNLFGRGQRLTLQAQLSSLRQLFSLSFWDQYFLDTRFTFAFDIYNRFTNYDSFNRGATGGALTWGYPLTDDIRVYFTYRGEYVNASTRSRRSVFSSGLTSPLPAGVQIANLFADGFTSSVRFNIQWDKRNNRLFPSEGFYHSAWAEFAPDFLGSQNVFNRYGAFSRWYQPIWGPIIFKFNAQIGYIDSSAAQGVPIFERFFVGGIMDVRGFRPRSLGPRVPILASPDPNENVVFFNKGGNKELLFNAEIEFPIVEKVGIRGVVFTDAGNAFDDDEDFALTGLRHSAGFGIRWFSPLGPLRFEWGFPLAPERDEDSMVFEFTIGNFF